MEQFELHFKTVESAKKFESLIKEIAKEKGLDNNMSCAQMQNLIQEAKVKFYAN